MDRFHVLLYGDGFLLALKVLYWEKIADGAWMKMTCWVAEALSQNDGNRKACEVDQTWQLFIFVSEGKIMCGICVVNL